MAFKASNIVPQEAYAVTKSAAVQLKLNVAAFISTLAANNASYEFLRDIYRTLARGKNQLNALASTPGLVDYAKVQEDDPAYDVVAEFSALLGAVANAMTWMETNVPLTVTLKPLAEWTDTTVIATTFTPAQTAAFRTHLSAVVNAIS